MVSRQSGGSEGWGERTARDWCPWACIIPRIRTERGKIAKESQLIADCSETPRARAGGTSFSTPYRVRGHQRAQTGQLKNLISGGRRATQTPRIDGTEVPVPDSTDTEDENMGPLPSSMKSLGA